MQDKLRNLQIFLKEARQLCSSYPALSQQELTRRLRPHGLTFTTHPNRPILQLHNKSMTILCTAVSHLPYQQFCTLRMDMLDDPQAGDHQAGQLIKEMRQPVFIGLDGLVIKGINVMGKLTVAHIEGGVVSLDSSIEGYDGMQGFPGLLLGDVCDRAGQVAIMSGVNRLLLELIYQWGIRKGGQQAAQYLKQLAY